MKQKLYNTQIIISFINQCYSFLLFFPLISSFPFFLFLFHFSSIYSIDQSFIHPFFSIIPPLSHPLHPTSPQSINQSFLSIIPPLSLSSPHPPTHSTIHSTTPPTTPPTIPPFIHSFIHPPTHPPTIPPPPHRGGGRGRSPQMWAAPSYWV